MGIVFASLFLPLDAAVSEKSSLLQHHRGEMIRAASAGRVSISDVKKIHVQMMQELEETGQKMSPADIAQFDSLFQSYVEHFNQQLQDDHDVDDNLWTKELAKDAKCYSFTEQRFSAGGDVHYREEELLIWHSKSQTCSKASKSWEIYSDAASTCMVSTGGLGHLHEVDGHADLFMKMSTMKTDIGLYHAMAPITSGLPTSCDADLVQLETKSCSLATSKLAACQAEGQCIGTVDLLSTKQEIEDRSEHRREAKYEMNKMTCKLNKMFEALNKNMTGDMNLTEMGLICDDDEKLGPADLKLTLVASSSTWCSDMTWGNQPSSHASSCQDWLDATYALWPSASHVVPTVCQTSCEQPPSPGLPPPLPAGCVDTNAASCEIFENHRDVCVTGHYKNDTFDPEDACCSCEGGSTKPAYSCTSDADWIPIVKYFDKGWVPTVDAHGDMKSDMTSTMDWAKLSDVDINTISSGLHWHYYKFTTESPSSTQKVIFVRTQEEYSDVSRSMGFAGGIEYCHVTEEFEDCTWEAQKVDDVRFDSFANTDNKCARWFTDYTANGQCHGVNGAADDNGRRCFNNGGCLPESYPILTGVTISKKCATFVP